MEAAQTGVIAELASPPSTTPLPLAPLSPPLVTVEQPLPLRSFGAFNLKGYRQGEQVGQGSYGTVYIYRKPHSDPITRHCEVIVKMTHDANHFENAVREIEIYKKLLHPNIVGYLGHLYGPQSILVIERGRCDLSNFINGSNSAYDQSCVNAWMTGILKAVHYLHELNLIHTDIKPGNVMMFRDAQRRFYPKLGDLGCCQYSHHDPSIAMNTFVQTQHYRSPEIQEYHRQGLKQGTFDSKIDIWSVGIILIDLLCHKCTYEDIAYHRPGHLNALRQYLLRQAYIPISAHSMTLLMDLLSQALSLQPAARVSAATLLQHAYWGDCAVTVQPPNQSYPKGIPRMLAISEEPYEKICEYWQAYYHDLPAKCVRDGVNYAYCVRSRVSLDFFRLVQYCIHVMSLFYLNETSLLKTIHHGHVDNLYALLNSTNFVIF